MIHSMTGFGKAEAKSDPLKVTVEIRSLNSKQADISLRLPYELRSAEIEARKIVSERLQRGKIDLFVSIDHLRREPAISFDTELASAYMDELNTLSQKTGIPLPVDPMRLIISFTGVQKSREESEEEVAEVRSLMFRALDEAISGLCEFRIQEGLSLYDVFRENLDQIEALLDSTDPYEEERITDVRLRLVENLKKYDLHEYDPGRLEQEMIYYIEKLDVNEEKNRLRNHLRYFRETMDLPEPGQGRKLGFIAQEMGREINTLGSKSNHTELQRIVVRMKDHLEQIKEQVLNAL